MSAMNQPLKLEGERDPNDPGQKILDRAARTGGVVYLRFYDTGPPEPFRVRHSPEQGIAYELDPVEEIRPDAQ